MTTDLAPFIIYAVDLLLLLILCRREHGLITLAVMNMLAVAAFGEYPVHFLGYTTNAGNPFYAMVMLIVSLEARAYQDNGRLFNACNLIFIALAFRLACGFYFQPGQNVNLISASFVAFYLSQFVNFQLLKAKFGMGAVKIIANVIAQAVDSIFFFSIFMLGVPEWKWQDAMVGGFLLKALLNILDTPIYLWILKRSKVIGMAATGLASM